MNRIIDLIIKNYRTVFVVIMLITIPFGYFYLNQTTLNHLDIYFDKDDPDLLFYKRFQKVYGNEEMGIIVFKDRDIFTKENIKLISKISGMAKNARGIQRVTSITEAKLSASDKDTLVFKNLIPEGELTHEKLEKARGRAVTNEILTNSIISEDGTTTAIMFELKPTDSNEERRVITQNIMHEARKIAGDKVRLHFTGSPYVEIEINRLTKLDNIRFTPITILIILIIVAFLLKRMLLALLSLANIILTIVWGIGMLTLCGEPMNMVTVIIAPVLLAISVASSIHILAHYRELHFLGDMSHLKAVSQSIKSLWLPCFFTSLTTSIGFFSFITTNVRPVKIVGIFTSIGVMYAFILTLTFLPVSLIFFRKRLDKDKRKPEELKESSEKGTFLKILSSIGNFTVTYYKPLSVISAIIIIFGVIGMFKLKFETNFANYLPETNIIKQDINFVEENLGGSVPIVMLIRAKSPEYDFTHPESIRLLDRVQHYSMEFMKKNYTWAFSVADYFKEMNMSLKSGQKKDYIIPDNRLDILDFYEIGDAEDLERIVSPDRMEARISFIARLSSSHEMRKINDELYARINEITGEHYTFRPTGSGPLYTEMEKKLKGSQIRSFSSAIACIFIMMLFLCRNLKLTLISMIPNIFPIVLTLGVMGWMGLPLDVSTIMIASITIGIAVDDTIHFLTWFRRNREAGIETRPALLKTFRDTGKPIVITSVVLCAAYFVLTLGSITPVITFGVLAALAMFFALVGDLFILPAVILLFKPEVGGKK